MTLYSYFDESEFEYQGKTYIAYGELITETKISKVLIQDALDELRVYQETLDSTAPTYNFNKSTLKNNYFHAKSDSSDAHSCICNVLKKIDGEFYIRCILKENHSLNDLAIDTALKSLVQDDNVIMFFEQRNNLSNDTIDRLYNDFDRILVFESMWNLFFPHYFAHPYRKICDKSNPGCQIIDFILWAYKNRYDKKKSCWFKYVNKNCMNGQILLETSVDDKQDDFFIDKTINKGLSLRKDNDAYKKYKNESFLNIDIQEEISYQFIEQIADRVISTMQMLRKKLNIQKKDFFEQQLIDGIDKMYKYDFQNLLFIFYKAFDSYKLYDLYPINRNIIKELFMARKIIAQARNNKEAYNINLQKILAEIFVSKGFTNNYIN